MGRGRRRENNVEIGDCELGSLMFGMRSRGVRYVCRWWVVGRIVDIAVGDIEEMSGKCDIDARNIPWIGTGIL